MTINSNRCFKRQENKKEVEFVFYSISNFFFFQLRTLARKKIKRRAETNWQSGRGGEAERKKRVKVEERRGSSCQWKITSDAANLKRTAAADGRRRKRGREKEI
jgi:hypothetical protein